MTNLHAYLIGGCSAGRYEWLDEREQYGAATAAVSPAALWPAVAHLYSVARPVTALAAAAQSHHQQPKHLSTCPPSLPTTS